MTQQMLDQLNRMEARLIKIDKLDAIESEVEKIGALEKRAEKTSDQIEKWAMPIYEMGAFLKQIAPTLATKVDLEKRPTRRQNIFNVFWITIALIGVVTIVVCNHRLFVKTVEWEDT